MKFKNYSIFSSFSLLFIFLFNLIVWQVFTKDFLQVKKDQQIGDLSRMSYLKSLRYEKNNRNNLLRRHSKFEGVFEDVDVITIGDSYSNGGGGGLNPFYQDFIASHYNFKVLNIMPISEGYIETILALNKTGFLEKFKPEFIILQSIERTAISRFSKEIDWLLTANEKELNKELFVRYRNNIPEYLFFNSSNFKSLLYNFLYQFDDNAFFSKAYLTTLDNDFFDTDEKNKLLFYFGDIQKISDSNTTNIEKMNNNLNKVSEILSKKKIKLIFMPNVDKYNLYSKYILDKSKYPKSRFFEELRLKNKNYIFVDTKKILRNLLDKGIKNVYFPDDTHWTDIGIYEVIQNIPFTQ